MQSVRDAHFREYLYSRILNSTSIEILKELLQLSDVYIFSGVIRDYFLKRQQETRDLDIVIEREIDWRSIYKRYRKKMKVKINSYGGFKTDINGLTIDIWSMERTWGLKQKGVCLTPQNLIRTALFNFSAIAYSVRRERFYIHKGFIEFIKTKRIGILYKDNPNIPLCIVNTMHYSQILGLPLSRELKQWIASRYNMFDNYETPQILHWGVVKYSHEEILRFVSQCEV